MAQFAKPSIFSAIGAFVSAEYEALQEQYVRQLEQRLRWQEEGGA